MTEKLRIGWLHDLRLLNLEGLVNVNREGLVNVNREGLVNVNREGLVNVSPETGNLFFSRYEGLFQCFLFKKTCARLQNRNHSAYMLKCLK